MKRLAVALLVAGVVAGSASAVTVGRVFQLGPHDSADFRGPAWMCTAQGRLTVACMNGDAAPWVEMTKGAKGVTVRVHVLAGANRGGLTLGSDGRGRTYTFTAFP